MSSVRDRGAAEALGLVLIAPFVILLAVLVVAMGRDVDARAQIRSAAEAGAQAAALERDPGSAEVAANNVARAMLIDTDACPDPQINVIYPPPGSPVSGISSGMVEVTIECTVSNRGIEDVRPRTHDEEVTAFASVDLFRASGSP